jgi:CDP-glycerol glycerophosphotransferase (TagB/SpsB family)
MNRKVKSLLSHIFQWTLCFFSGFVPKKKKLIVFSMSKGRYWDNSRALFEFLSHSGYAQMEVYWLSDPMLDCAQIPSRYLDRFVSRNSLLGWWVASRSEGVVVSYSLGDFGYLRKVIRRKKVLMLWHAITVKHVGLLDKKFDLSKKLKYINNETRYYNRMIASSDIDRYYWAGANKILPEKIAITGLPRNDRLCERELCKSMERSDFRVLYAPTFRDYSLGNSSVFSPLIII